MRVYLLLAAGGAAHLGNVRRRSARKHALEAWIRDQYLWPPDAEDRTWDELGRRFRSLGRQERETMRVLLSERRDASQDGAMLLEIMDAAAYLTR